MKTTRCKKCNKKMPIRNELAEQLIKEHGRPLCGDCRDEVVFMNGVDVGKRLSEYEELKF